MPVISDDSTIAWFRERHANAARIAFTKFDPEERAGWLEDAAYFEHAIAMMEALQVLVRS
jgi:hypothetical protein